MGQPCVRALLHLSSTPSLGGAVPCARTSAPHSLTFLCMQVPWRSAASTLSLGRGPCVHVQPVGPHSSFLPYSLDQSLGGKTYTYTMVPFCSSELQEGWLGCAIAALHAGQKTWMELLPTIYALEKRKQWHSWIVPSAPENSCISSTFSMQKLFNWLSVVPQEELL